MNKEYNTYDGWNTLGFRVKKGEKSNTRNDKNIALFSDKQVYSINNKDTTTKENKNTDPNNEWENFKDDCSFNLRRWENFKHEFKDKAYLRMSLIFLGDATFKPTCNDDIENHTNAVEFLPLKEIFKLDLDIYHNPEMMWWVRGEIRDERGKITSMYWADYQPILKIEKGLETNGAKRKFYDKDSQLYTNMLKRK